MFSIDESTYHQLSQTEKEKVSEIKIYYVNQYKALLGAQRYPDLSILFHINLITKPILSSIVDECAELIAAYPNVMFDVDVISNSFIKKCGDHVILSKYSHAVYTEESANSLYNIGIKNMYVTGSLAANLIALNRLKNKGIKIRIIPNVVQANSPGLFNMYGADPLQCFWIRPQAISLYEPIVDKFEFMIGQSVQERGLLDLYTKGNWKGSLNSFLINNHNLAIDSNTYTADYPIEIDNCRSVCGLSCQKNNRCHACLTIKFLSTESEKIKEKDLL